MLRIIIILETLDKGSSANSLRWRQAIKCLLGSVVLLGIGAASGFVGYYLGASDDDPERSQWLVLQGDGSVTLSQQAFFGDIHLEITNIGGTAKFLESNNNAELFSLGYIITTASGLTNTGCLMPRTKSSISNNVRALRFNHGEMTQHELAQKVGVARHS